MALATVKFASDGKWFYAVNKIGSSKTIRLLKDTEKKGIARIKGKGKDTKYVIGQSK